MPRRTRALPALASPCSRRCAPLSSGAPVRPAGRTAWQESAGTARFVVDSPVEGAGFEPSAPLEVLTVGIVPCRLRGPFHASLPKTKFAADSALEETGIRTI